MSRNFDNARPSTRSEWLQKLTRFIFQDSAGMSLEWVALAAGLVVAAIVIGVIVIDNAAGPAASIGNQLPVYGSPPPP